VVQAIVPFVELNPAGTVNVGLDAAHTLAESGIGGVIVGCPVRSSVNVVLDGAHEGLLTVMVRVTVAPFAISDGLKIYHGVVVVSDPAWNVPVVCVLLAVQSIVPLVAV
jgi:hypothetical protein